MDPDTEWFVLVGFWHWFPPLVAIVVLVFFRVGSDYRSVRGLGALRQVGGTGDS